MGKDWSCVSPLVPVFRGTRNETSSKESVGVHLRMASRDQVMKLFVYGLFMMVI